MPSLLSLTYSRSHGPNFVWPPRQPWRRTWVRSGETPICWRDISPPLPFLFLQLSWTFSSYVSSSLLFSTLKLFIISFKRIQYSNRDQSGNWLYDDAVDKISWNYQKRQIIKRNFMEKSHFPECIGAIDCTLVAIISPNNEEHSYLNWKRFHQ